MVGDEVHAKKRRLIAYYKSILGNKCVSCATTDRLQFDHIDPSTKLFDVTTRILYSKKKLDAEVAKCQLLCISCHAKKTHKDNGHNLYEKGHGNVSYYLHEKCRCELCVEAHNEASREHYRLHGKKKLIASTEGEK